MREITLKECPRPQFVRDGWQSLDGKWGFCLDNDGTGEARGFARGFQKEHDIFVPFAYQSKASGIGLEKRCDNVWYERTFMLNKRTDKRYFLHIEGADYCTKVFVNGAFAGADKGAYHRLTFDLTHLLHDGENLLVIKCEDDYSTEKPRGKQRWKDESWGCFYVDTTGIWKTVWLETAGKDYVRSLQITPSLSQGSVMFAYDVCAKRGTSLEILVSYEGERAASVKFPVRTQRGRKTVLLPQPLQLWEVGNGRLYDVEVRLYDGETLLDQVKSYFGMRGIAAKDGKILLNGRPLYQKLVLDQGYFGDCQLTPPSPQALMDDIKMMLAYGFNGARKHQKLEDERFYYYADVMGYLVWAEMPSMFDNTPRSRAAFKREWRLLVKQLIDHPAIIVWVPLNESWGAKQIKTDKIQQRFANEVYYLTKDLDPARLCVCNDGWEHTVGDLMTIHDYDQDGARLYSDFDTLEKAVADQWGHHPRGAFAQGYRYSGQPVMFTEFGGTAYAKNLVGENWGYGNAVKDDEEYLARLEGLFGALNQIPYSCGYCFTQLSDVQQEANGLLSEGRKTKIDPALLRKVQEMRNE